MLLEEKKKEETEKSTENETHHDPTSSFHPFQPHPVVAVCLLCFSLV